VEQSVKDLLKKEEQFGMKKYETYEKFGEKIYTIKKNVKKNIKNLKDWKEISQLIPKKFKVTKKLKKSGLAGFFAASLELTKEGLIRIMQKKNFDALLIKERK